MKNDYGASGGPCPASRSPADLVIARGKDFNNGGSSDLDWSFVRLGDDPKFPGI